MVAVGVAGTTKDTAGLRRLIMVRRVKTPTVKDINKIKAFLIYILMESAANFTCFIRIRWLHLCAEEGSERSGSRGV